MPLDLSCCFLFAIAFLCHSFFLSINSNNNFVSTWKYLKSLESTFFVVIYLLLLLLLYLYNLYLQKYQTNPILIFFFIFFPFWFFFYCLFSIYITSFQNISFVAQYVFVTFSRIFNTKVIQCKKQFCHTYWKGWALKSNAKYYKKLLHISLNGSNTVFQKYLFFQGTTKHNNNNTNKNF